jgi:hypothetical protein
MNSYFFLATPLVPVCGLPALVDLLMAVEGLPARGLLGLVRPVALLTALPDD